MRLTAHYCVATDSPIADFLAASSGLSKVKVKECMNKGGVWLRRRKGKEERCRKATTRLAPGDTVSLYFDQEILQITPPAPLLVADLKAYSVWDKPAGLLSQGTRFGDHCSMLRMAAQAFTPMRPTYLVHRLDREASGLIVIAHTPKAAAALSGLWQTRQVNKEYRITVKGVWNREESGQITLPLDGKEATTGYRVLNVHAESASTTLLVTLQTGRLHQIRRHFALIGFPVIGDPTYGTGNKNTAGLVLRAVRLAFPCPLSGVVREFTLAPDFGLPPSPPPPLPDSSQALPQPHENL